MLGDVPIINQRVDTSRQDAVNQRLKLLHDTILQDVERNDKSFDLFQRDTKGDELIDRAKSFLAKDQEVRDKAGGPTIKREKFQTSYWSQWNSDKNILEGESAREFAQHQREDPVLVKLRRKKLAHLKMKEAKEAAQKEYRSKRIVTHGFDAPGKSGKFELPPIGQVTNVDHDQVFVEYVFRNCVAPSEEEGTPIEDGTGTKRPLSSHKEKEKETFTTKGGALSMAPRLLAPTKASTTAGCDIPPLPSALEKAMETRMVNTFGSASRFPAPTVASSSSSPSVPVVSTSVGPPKSVTNLGHTFGVAARFPSEDKKTAETGETKESSGAKAVEESEIPLPDVTGVPGPGHYTVTRLFDPPANPLAKHSVKKLTENYETFDLLHERQKIMRKVHYGFHCHMHDHVRFGLCGVPGTASGNHQHSMEHNDNDDDDSHQTSRSFGVTLLPNMCHCCHHTHYDTRRLRDPTIAREAHEQIEREIREAEEAKRAAEEAEDLLLGRHLRTLQVKEEKLRKYVDTEDASDVVVDASQENNHNSHNNHDHNITTGSLISTEELQPLGDGSVFAESSTVSTSLQPLVNAVFPPTASLTLTSVSSQSGSKTGGVPKRDITQYYSNRKKKEIRDAALARERAIRKVREEDVFLAAVEEAGLIPRPIYQLTALMTAALKEDLEAIRIMAQNFIDPNQRQPETLQTALHHAAHANKVRSVQAILKYFHPEYQLKYRKNTTDNIHRHPLQVNLRDHQGDTAVHIACRAGHLEVVEAITADERCRPAIPPTTQSQDRRDWLNFIISGGRADRGDDTAQENQRNHRGEFETDLCYRYHNRSIGHRMWQCVNAAIIRKQKTQSQHGAATTTNRLHDHNATS